MANCFWMFLHCLADNLLVLLLRRHITAPPVQDASPPLDYRAPDPETQDQRPREPRAGQARRRDFNGRREADPLAERQART